MEFLKEYFQNRLRIYIPIFLVAYTLVFYLSTKFLITDELLIDNFQGVGTTREIEGGHTFFSLLFGFVYVKSVLSIFLKASVISFIISLLVNRKFVDVFRVAMLSSFVYIIGRAIQFVYFVFFEPEKIKTLETNIFSLYAIIDTDQYSTFIRKLAYHSNLIELAFIVLLIYGLGLGNVNSTPGRILLTVVIIDIGYIILSALL